MVQVESRANAGKICQETVRQVGLRLPESINRLLDSLVEQANTSGANTSRKEIVSALILQSLPAGGSDLLDTVVKYRRAETKDLPPQATATARNDTRRTRG